MNTSPSLIFDTKVLENGIIRIPELENWKDKDIHVVVVLRNENQVQSKKSISLAGSLKQFAKPELIDIETDLAWSKIKDK